jgi:hypothetical protein
MKTTVLALLMLSACAAEVSTEAAEVGAESAAITTCSPMLRYHLWLAATAKVSYNDCYEGPYFLADGSTVGSVLCAVHPANGAPAVYRYYGIQRQGLNRFGTLSFDNYACAFNVCDQYQASMTCDCTRCVTSGYTPDNR